MSIRFSDFRGGLRVSLLSLASFTALWSQRAWVVNQGSNNVSVIDTATNTVLTTIVIPVQPDPFSAAPEIAVTPDGIRAYVTVGGNIVVIDLATNTVITTIPAGGSPKVAVSRDGSRLYVLIGANAVSVMSTATNTFLNTIALPPPAGIPPFTAGIADLIGITPDGSRVYVGTEFHFTDPGGSLLCCSVGVLNVIDAMTNTPLNTVPVSCCPNQLAFTPDSRRAVMTLLPGKSFPFVGGPLAALIDTAANTSLALFGQFRDQIGDQVAITPDGSRAYVTARGVGPGGSSGAPLYRIDIASAGTTPVPVAARFMAITPDGSRMYAITPSDTISVISTSTNTVLTTIPVGLNPSRIVITPDGARAYVTNSGSDTVSVINTATNTVMATIAVGDMPSRIALTPRVTRPAVPKNDFVTPGSGAGMSGVFTFEYSHPNGSSSLIQLFGSLNDTAFGRQGCNVLYRSDMEGLFLKNETDDGWLGPLTGAPSQSGTRFSGSLSNSRCTLDGNASSVSRSGNTLALSAALAFTPAFAGAKGIFMYAIDSGGLSTPTREQRGTWTVVATAGPTSDSVTPSSGAGASGVFTFRYSSPAGHTQLRQVFGALNATAFGAQGCNTMYLRDNNGLYLKNDTDDGWLGPMTPRSSASISNSRCTLRAGESSVSGSGNTLTMVVSLTFRPAFAGLKGIYLYAIDSTGLTTPTREQRGTWMVTAGP